MAECFLTLLIYMQLSSFPNTTCWRDRLFSIVYSCPFCWRLIDCRCVNLSLGFLFCPVNPYVCFCANTMLLWLLWLCSIVWSLGGLCLLLCSFFSGMLWQFWIFLWFHINFMITCSSSVKNVMGNLIVCGCVHAQLCLTLCDPMDYTIHGILQARLLEWVAFPFSRGSSQPRDQTQVSHIAGGFFTSWAAREAQEHQSG